MRKEPVRAPAVLLAEVSAALSRGVGNPALAHQRDGAVAVGIAEIWIER